MSELAELLAEKRRRELASTDDDELDALLAEQRRRSRPKRTRAESAISGAADAAGFGFGDELKGGLDAGIAAVQGRDAREAYGRSVADSRRYQAEAQEDNPISYLGGQIAGGFVPGSVAIRGANALVKAGSAGARFAQARPVSSLLVTGASGGAAAGATYGAGTDHEDRVRGAKEGAAWGLALGAGGGVVFPAVGNLTRPIVQPVANALFRRGASPTAMVNRDLQRMAKRRGLTEEVAEEIASEAEQTGRNPTGARVLGEPGLTRLQANARASGKSGQAVENFALAERQQQAQRLAADMDTVLPRASARQATGEIADQFEEASKTLYQPVLAGEVRAESMAKLQSVLARLPDAVTQRVQQVAANLARTEGADAARMTTAQQAHLIKRALDDVLSTMRREGLGADEFRALTRLKRDLLDAMDEGIEGYRGARQTWGGISEAREAMEVGQDFLTMRVDELTEYAQGLTEAQRRYFEIGIRDRLEQLVSDVGSAPTRTNLAGRLEAGRVQERLKAVLGDRAEGLLKRIGVESRDFRDQSRVLASVNSPTSNVLLDLADQAAAAPSPTNVLASMGRGMWRGVTNVLMEGKRNRETQTLLQKLTPAQIRALRDVIRERMARRRGAASEAIRGGVVGSIGIIE